MEEVPRPEYGASKKHGTLTNGKGSRRLERQMPPTPQVFSPSDLFHGLLQSESLPAQKTDLRTHTQSSQP